MAKLLIVDDSSEIREMFDCFFSESDTVKTAASGLQALDRIKSFVPDIMLVDISMPQMTGPEFLARLEELALTDERLRNIPFIMLTGEDADTLYKYDHIKANPNCKAFLNKMTPLESVAARINNILAHYGKF